MWLNCERFLADIAPNHIANRSGSLSQEETIELCQQARNGNQDAQLKLIVGHFGLVTSTILRCQNQIESRGCDPEDILSAAVFGHKGDQGGLLLAALRFDEQARTNFSTFAVPYIFGAILREIAGHNYESRYLQILAQQTVREMARLKDQGQQPELEEIVRAVAPRASPKTQEAVERMIIQGSKFSLEAFDAWEDCPSLESAWFLAESDFDLEGVLDQMVRITIIDWINKSPLLLEAEKPTLIEYFFENKTLYEIADRSGLTPQGIHRRLKKALAKLSKDSGLFTLLTE